MRVALVISSLARGGAEKNLVALANHLADRGVQVDLLTYAPAATPAAYPLDSRISLENLNLTRRSSGPVSAIGNNTRRIRVLRSALRRLGPDALICFGDQTNVSCLLAGIGTGIPTIVSERIDPSAHPVGPGWHLLRRLSYSRAARIVVQAEAFARHFPPGLRQRIAVIGNPVEVRPDAAKSGPPLPEQAILAAGRLDRQKGFDTLIRSFAATKRSRQGWSLWIFGEGPEREALEQLAADLECAGAVHLPGRTEHLQGVMSRAAIFALSSRYEGQPNVLAEAMAHGLPVVATDCPGVLEMVTHDTEGLLVERENETQMADALDRLMSDASLRHRLGQAATGVAVRFAPESILPRWDRLIEQIVAERSRRHR